MGIRIISAGSYLPELIVTNDNLSEFLDTNDEWISTRTGIRQRHKIRCREYTICINGKYAK